MNPKIHTFIASPKLITTLATPGILRFNSETDFLRGKNGRKFKLEAPDADELHQVEINPQARYIPAPVPKNSSGQGGR